MFTIYKLNKVDDVFFGIGPECVEIVGLELELSLGRSAGSRCGASLQKQITKRGDWRGLAHRHSDA